MAGDANASTVSGGAAPQGRDVDLAGKKSGPTWSDERRVRLTPVRLLKLAALVLILVLAPPLFGTTYFTTVMISILLFGVLGATYDFMIGYAGLSNFGVAGVLAVGSYSSALAAVKLGIDPWFGLLIGGASAAAAGLFMGLVAIRAWGIYFGIITWFMGEVIRLSISNAPSVTRGALGLTVPPFPDLLGIDFSRGSGVMPYYYLMLVLGFAMMVTMHMIVRSRLGLAFEAIREDQLATESLGLRPVKYKILNLVIASFFIGVLGSFYAHYIGAISPSISEFGVTRSVEVLTVTYLGGRGTLWGSLFGALLMVGFQEYFRWLGALRLLLFGVVLIVIIIFVPRGLAGLKRWVW